MSRPATWLDLRLFGGRAYALLCLLCLVLYLPGITTIPVLDRDEARFAQASRQMLESGDFLNIRFQDEARNKKPAGIYWLQAASVALFSTPESRAIWPYRLPSVIGATLAVLLTFAFGARFFGPTTGLLGAALLASSLAVMAEAHIAKTDAMQLAAAVAAQGALGLAYIRGRAGERVSVAVAAVFWAAQAVAILLKGPPIPVLSLITIVSLAMADRGAGWLRSLRPVPGLLLTVAVLSPWLIAIQQSTGGRFLSDSLGQDLLSKLIGAQESHGAPPFYYLLLTPVTFWPGSVLLLAGAIRVWRHRDQPVERFLLCWLLPAWLLLELVPTKLPHYVLPLYPALALIAAAALTPPSLTAFAELRATWSVRADAAVRCLWAGITVFLAAAMVVLPLRFGDQVSVLGITGAVALIGLGAAVVFRPQTQEAVAKTAGLSLVLVIAAGWGVLPGLNRLWLSRAVAALASEHPRPAGAPFLMLGYNEPSLVFLLGADIRAGTPKTAAEALGSGGQVLVSGREEAAFRQALTLRGMTAASVGEVRGLDYSNGQRMVLTLYQPAP